MIDYSKIGARIKGYRNEKGLSQEELGIKVSVDHRHISGIESGRKSPSLELIIRIANALEVSADDILVDALDHSTATTGDEIHFLLLDCTDAERKMLTRTMKFMKALLSEFGI